MFRKLMDHIAHKLGYLTQLDVSGELAARNEAWAQLLTWVNQDPNRILPRVRANMRQERMRLLALTQQLHRLEKLPATDARTTKIAALKRRIDMGWTTYIDNSTQLACFAMGLNDVPAIQLPEVVQEMTFELAAA